MLTAQFEVLASPVSNSMSNSNSPNPTVLMSTSTEVASALANVASAPPKNTFLMVPKSVPVKVAVVPLNEASVIVGELVAAVSEKLLDEANTTACERSLEIRESLPVVPALTLQV